MEWRDDFNTREMAEVLDMMHRNDWSACRIYRWMETTEKTREHIEEMKNVLRTGGRAQDVDKKMEELREKAIACITIVEDEINQQVQDMYHRLRIAHATKDEPAEAAPKAHRGARKHDFYFVYQNTVVQALSHRRGMRKDEVDTIISFFDANKDEKDLMGPPDDMDDEEDRDLREEHVSTGVGYEEIATRIEQAFNTVRAMMAHAAKNANRGSVANPMDWEEDFFTTEMGEFIKMAKTRVEKHVWSKMVIAVGQQLTKMEQILLDKDNTTCQGMENETLVVIRTIEEALVMVRVVPLSATAGSGDQIEAGRRKEEGTFCVLFGQKILDAMVEGRMPSKDEVGEVIEFFACNEDNEEAMAPPVAVDKMRQEGWKPSCRPVWPLPSSSPKKPEVRPIWYGDGLVMARGALAGLKMTNGEVDEEQPEIQFVKVSEEIKAEFKKVDDYIREHGLIPDMDKHTRKGDDNRWARFLCCVVENALWTLNSEAKAKGGGTKEKPYEWKRPNVTDILSQTAARIDTTEPFSKLVKKENEKAEVTDGLGKELVKALEVLEPTHGSEEQQSAWDAAMRIATALGGEPPRRKSRQVKKPKSTNLAKLCTKYLVHPWIEKKYKSGKCYKSEELKAFVDGALGLDDEAFKVPSGFDKDKKQAVIMCMEEVEKEGTKEGFAEDWARVFARFQAKWK
ncbi:hypothetical protein FRB99_008603 [Tulasnella sp. 403]|nr:hypothetical protein FRB99_008603 [Tulasnella sp. 403]